MNSDFKVGVSVRVLNSEKSELAELARTHDLSLDRVTRWAIRLGLEEIREIPPLPSVVKDKPLAISAETIIQ
jgi:hypothetical protein